MKNKLTIKELDYLVERIEKETSVQDRLRVIYHLLVSITEEDIAPVATFIEPYAVEIERVAKANLLMVDKHNGTDRNKS